MSIRAVRQTPYKKYNGTAPTECTDTVIPYRIGHVYVLESGLDFWPCTNTRYVCESNKSLLGQSNSRLGAVQALSAQCTHVMRKISNGSCAKLCRLSVVQSNVCKCTHLYSTCITATNLLCLIHGQKSNPDSRT